MAELPSAGQLASSRLPRTLMTPSSPTLAEINSTSGPDGFTPDEERCVSSYDDEKASDPTKPEMTTLLGAIRTVVEPSVNPIPSQVPWGLSATASTWNSIISPSSSHLKAMGPAVTQLLR